jgi:hypothetical protein
MPYSIRKAKCKQTDGDSGSYTLSYTDNKGKRHRNCHTSRKKARAQISAIEMPEGVDDLDEGWVPLATRITEMLERELAELAGSFKSTNEGSGDPGFKRGDRVRPSRVSSEIMVHTQGKVPLGTIVNDNDDGTYDVDWDPLPSPGRLDDPDLGEWEPEDNVERRVKGSTLKRSKIS